MKPTRERSRSETSMALPTEESQRLERSGVTWRLAEEVGGEGVMNRRLETSQLTTSEMLRSMGQTHSQEEEHDADTLLGVLDTGPAMSTPKLTADSVREEEEISVARLPRLQRLMSDSRAASMSKLLIPDTKGLMPDIPGEGSSNSISRPVLISTPEEKSQGVEGRGRSPL